MFDKVVGTQIFNADDISALKVQCQTWNDDVNTPPSDFVGNFNDTFILSSIFDLFDVDLDGWTAGNVLKFTTSGGLVPAVDIAISGGGMLPSENHFITGSFQFDNGSLSIGPLTGRHTFYTESDTGKIVTIPNIDGGYMVLSSTSGLGCSEGMAFFIDSNGLAEHRFITSGDILNISEKRTESITLNSPTSTEDVSVFYTTEAITISQLTCVLVGSSFPSISWTIRHSSNRNLTGNEVVTSGSSTSNTTTGDIITSFNDETIPAGSFIWVEITSKSGVVDEYHLTIEYSVD